MKKQTSINFAAAEILDQLKTEPPKNGTGFYEGNQKVNKLLKQILSNSVNWKHVRNTLINED